MAERGRNNEQGQKGMVNDQDMSRAERDGQLNEELRGMLRKKNEESRRNMSNKDTDRRTRNR